MYIELQKAKPALGCDSTYLQIIDYISISVLAGLRETSLQKKE